MKELEKALAKLDVKVQKKVLMKALRAGAKPTVKAAKANAPYKRGKLEGSIKAGTALNRNQRKHQKARKDKYSAELYVGSTDPKAHLVEFGTSPHIVGGKFKGAEHPGTDADPFLTPAWEVTKEQVLEKIKEELAKNIIREI